MAAESVGLAASVAGLLSLGLQVTEGIVKYVDAFDCRQEDLAWAKLRNDSLRTTMRAIEASLPSLRNQHQEYVEAAIQNIEACKEKLRFVESLRLELIDSTTSTSKLRLETGKKRLMYPFRRPKLQQLA
ncbi:hypothetical protein K456DRAFT_397288 [Colletotrichum gloeosporioides 23]|nr:hypothetical protein K456DRAFT_397288 [Colletotrichum gloeosporioides 23]